MLLSWLRSNDAAVSFLKVHAAHRKQRNLLSSLSVGTQTITDHDEMVEAAFVHFSNVLGSASERDIMLDLQAIRVPQFNLLELDTPFNDEEIWNAVKSLPTGRHLAPMV